MNKKHLTTLALVVLVIINTVFAGLVYSNHKKNNYYDEKNISDLCDILRESNIELGENIFPKKRVELPAYELSFTEVDLREAARSITGTVTQRADGSVSVANDSGMYILKRDFTFEYISNGYESVDLGAEAETESAEMNTNAAALFGEYRADQQSRGQKRPEFKYVVEKSTAYASGYAVSLVREYADGVQTKNSYYAIMKDGAAVYAAGSITLVAPSAEYRAKCLDLMSVLIKEKQYFNDLGGEEIHTVSSISYVYDVCFDVIGTAYLIPSCKIDYTNGVSHTYDLVSGELIYTENF